MIELHILDKVHKLDNFRNEIQKSFADGVIKIQALLPVDDVDITIAHNPEGTIPEIGVGGYAPTANLIFISIDSEFKGLEDFLYAEVQSTLAHELHHCARSKEVGYGNTLWEAMISEGLAGHFDIEVNGGNPKPWDIAFTSQDDLLKMQAKASPHYKATTYNHSDWFFGKGDEGIVRWTGYTLGFHMVGEYLKSHPEMTAAKLYKTPAEDFWKVLFP